MTTHDGPILIAVSGTDKPGITAEFADILAAAHVQLIDVEQVTVSGQLTLNFLVQMPTPVTKLTCSKIYFGSHEARRHSRLKIDEVSPRRRIRAVVGNHIAIP